MVMVTGPDGDNFSLVNNSKATNTINSIKKATTVINIVPPVLVAKIILIFLRRYMKFLFRRFPYLLYWYPLQEALPLPLLLNFRLLQVPLRLLP